MKQTAVLFLLLLFLGFSSCVFSAAAIPIIRSLKSIEKDSPVHELLAEGLFDMSKFEEVSSVEEDVYIEGRMDVERLDYPGTGANNHHDPKTPARA